MKKTKFQKTQISAFVDAIFTNNSKKKFTAGAVALSLMAGVGLVHAAPVSLELDNLGAEGTGSPASYSMYFTAPTYAANTREGDLGPTLGTGGTANERFVNQASLASSIYTNGVSIVPSYAGAQEVININNDINWNFIGSSCGASAICNDDVDGVAVTISNGISAATTTLQYDEVNNNALTGQYDESLTVNVSESIFGGQYGVYVDGFQGALVINNTSTINGGRGLDFENGAGIAAFGQLTGSSNSGYANSFTLSNGGYQNGGPGYINGETYGVTVDGFSTVSIYNGEDSVIGGQLLESNVPVTALNIQNIGNFINTGDATTVTVQNSGNIIGQTGIAINGINYWNDSVNNQSQGNVGIQNIFGGEIHGLNGDAIQVGWVGGGLEILNISNLGEDSSVISGLRYGINANNIEREVGIYNSEGSLIHGEYHSAINLNNTGAVTIENDGVISSNGRGADQGINDYNNEVIEVSNVNFGGVTITNRGSILGLATSNYQDAIDIEDIMGDVVIVNTSTGIISAPGDVLQIDNVTGNVVITNEGRMLTSLADERGDNVIDLDTIYGSLTVINHGEMTANYEVVHGYNIDGSVNISNSGTMTAVDDVIHIENTHGNFNLVNTGTMSSAQARIIDLEQTDSDFTLNSVTITNNGTMSAFQEILEIDGEDRVGNIAFTNNGSMTGGMNIYSTTGTVGIVNNGTWTMGYAGVDAQENDLSGGRDGVYLSDTGAATITNNGVINLRGYTEIEAMSGTVLTFNNRGTIDMTADHDNSEGKYSNLNFYAGGDGSQITFNGTVDGVSGQIKIDALLGSESGTGALQSNNDSIYIEGLATGQTSIRVTDASPSVAGVNNPVGNVVVSVTDLETANSAFTLAGGPINKGLWQYDLYTTQDEDGKYWRLASVPSSQAFELPQIISAAQNVWFLGADAVQERSQELRLADGKRANGGAWAKVLGGRDRSFVDNSYTLDGKTSTYNTDSRQTIGGLMIGADGTIDLASGGQWLLGGMFGGTTAKQSFNATGSTSNNQSATVGLYANYSGKDGGFVNLLVKGDFGSADYSLNNGAGISAKQKISTNSVGGQIQTGYRFASPYAFVEPVLSIGTVSVSSDTFNLLATDVTTNTGKSTRGSVGFNTGFTVPVGSVTLSPVLSAKYVNDFDGDNRVGLTSGDQAMLSVSDTRAKNYGQYALSLKVAGSKSGSYGYARVQQNSGSSTNSTSATVGMKVVW